MSNGRNCDNCDTHLNDEDYVSYGSWSYTCHDCGFVYRHGLNVSEQVEKFNSRPTKHAPDVAMCEDCGKSPAMEGCSVCAECGL